MKTEKGEIARKNRLDVGRYDVVIKSAPAVLSSADERYKAAEKIMEILASVDPELAAQFLPTMLQEIDSAAADPLRDLLAAREKAKEEAAQSPEAQMQAQAQELEMARAQMELKELDSRALKNAAAAKETLERAKYHGHYARAENKGAIGGAAADNAEKKEAKE